MARLSHPYPSFAQLDQLSIPNITPYWIKRQAYDTSKSLVLSKGKSSQASQDSFFSGKSLLTVIPSVAGGGGIVLGSVLTWLNIQKKQKMFKKYMDEIVQAEKEYDEAKIKNPKQRNTLSQLKEKFSKLLEEADLAVGDKKIDDDHRTTISHTIERKLEEIEKSA